MIVAHSYRIVVLHCANSAYVTGNFDLIKKQNTVQDFKTGRGEGPELLQKG